LGLGEILKNVSFGVLMGPNELNIHALELREMLLVITPPLVDFVDGNEGKACEYVDVWIAILVKLNDAQIVKPFEPLDFPEVITETLEEPRDPRVDVAKRIL